jgi:hypothetical protein
MALGKVSTLTISSRPQSSVGEHPVKKSVLNLVRQHVRTIGVLFIHYLRARSIESPQKWIGGEANVSHVRLWPILLQSPFPLLTKIFLGCARDF